MKKDTPQNKGKTEEWSANLGGRPKKDLAAEIARMVFEKNPKAIEKAMLKALLKGNPKLFAVLADRARGNPGSNPKKDVAAEIARKVLEQYSRRVKRGVQK